MTVLQVLRRAWEFRHERSGLFEQPGPWERWVCDFSTRVRLTPTIDEMGYPAAMIKEHARGYHWIVRDALGVALAEGDCIDSDTAEVRADSAAKALGPWRLGWMPCA